MQYNNFEQFFSVCLSMASGIKQKTAMLKCKNLYEEYYDEGKSPEQAMLEEWG